MRDRELSSVDQDERPWFQLMKRRRCVTEVVQQKRDDVGGNSYGDGEVSIYCEEDAGQKQLQTQSDPHSFPYDHRQEKAREKVSKVTPPPHGKSYNGFRSGLQLLLEPEK